MTSWVMHASGLLDALSALRSWWPTRVWDDVSLAHPWALWLLLPVWAAFAWRWRNDHKRAHVPLGQGGLLSSLPVGRLVWWQRVAGVAACVACSLVVMALAKPQLRGQPDPTTENGIDIVVALDVSTSMRAADFKPTDRMTVAKKVIADHVLSRTNDRVGLVVFAGEVFTQAPLTHDHELLREVLAGVRTGVIADGTAIGDGLALSVARLQASEAKTKTVILVTDGDNNAGALAPLSALKLAVDEGVRVYSILCGKGGKVPYPDGTDVFGQTHYTQVDMPVNPELLKKIAKESGGLFYQATDSTSLSTSFQQALADLDRSVLQGAPPVRRSIDISIVWLLCAWCCMLPVLWWRLGHGLVLAADEDKRS
jgi:Ca-activated chloride channel homolog